MLIKLTLSAFVAIGLTLSALGQNLGSTDVTDMNFDQILVEGNFKSPSISALEGSGSLQRNPLLDLRSSFKDRLKASDAKRKRLEMKR